MSIYAPDTFQKVLFIALHGRQKGDLAAWGRTGL